MIQKGTLDIRAHLFKHYAKENAKEFDKENSSFESKDDEVEEPRAAFMK